MFSRHGEGAKPVIGETVRDVQFLPRFGNKHKGHDTFVVTDANVYSLHMEGYSRCSGFTYRKAPDGLPSEFVGRKIVGVRSNGESIIIELEGGVFIYRSFTINTRTGGSAIEVTIHAGDDLTKELRDFYENDMTEAAESDRV